MYLASLHTYPLKSGMGLTWQQQAIHPYGLQDDRCWMVVDDHGMALTAREHPLLVLVQIAQHAGQWQVQAPNMPTLTLNLHDWCTPIDVELWLKPVLAQAGPRDADDWFSRYLGGPCRVCYIGEAPARRVEGESDLPIGFADGFPLLILGEGSLKDLNLRLKTPAELARFRPNLFIAGAEAYEEDHWKVIRVGEVEITLHSPCPRCILTTVNPENGLKHAADEPLSTLTTYRIGYRGVHFGMNAFTRQHGVLQVGDPVEVLEWDF